MVFKTVDGHLTNIFNKVEKIKTGFNLTNEEVQKFVKDFNVFNSKQNFGQDYEKFIKNVTDKDLNVSLMFSELAEKGASAKASIEGVYAAILDGNTTGFANVKSTMTLFNQAQQSGADNARAFAKAVGQSNTQLGNYLGGLNGAKASLVGYGTQLAITTAKTIGLRAVTMALNAALTWGISAGISALISWLDDMIVTEKELAEQAKQTADEAKQSYLQSYPFTNPHSPHNIKKRKIAGATLRSSAEYITERRGKMNENDKCSTDGLTIPRGRFPQDTPIAMAYVPYQEWEDTYAENVALAKGTIFPSLDMPFLGKEGVAQYGK